MGLNPAGLLFTGSGVEAIATALFGLVRRPQSGGLAPVVASVAERPESAAMLEVLEEEGREWRRVPVGGGGRIDLGAWQEALAGPAGAALLHHANHQTGALQPVTEAAQLCREAGVPLVLDATWSFGRTALPAEAVEMAGIAAISGHRAGGPPAVGAVWVRPDLNLRPLVPGGGERGRRGGMEPVAGAVGLACLAALREERGAGEDDGIRRLRDRMEEEILGTVPRAFRNGEEPRLPGTSNLSFPGLEGEALAVRLDLEGVGVSAGTACSSGSARPGHVLPAMGLGPERVQSSVRISLGWSTTAGETECLCRILPGLVQDLRAVHPQGENRGPRQ
jgi:cysteine desulfurase